MAERLPFTSLTRYDPSDPISADGYSLQDRNQRLLDYLLRLVWEGARDGHAALADPTDELTSVTTDDTGGQIPSDLSLTVGYTLLDADGGETALAPATVVETIAGLVEPDDSPVLSTDDTGGALLAGPYEYAVTLIDDSGGETAIGPSAEIIVPSGTATNRIIIDGLAALVVDAGASGWRLWRATADQHFALVHQDATGLDQWIDDGFGAVDCGVTPPSVTGTTRATSVLHVTTPAVALPGAAQFRIYVGINGDFGPLSLLGTYPVSELGDTKDYTELALLPGEPPEQSTAMAAIPGGGGGGSISYPVQWSDDFTADTYSNQAGQRALVMDRDIRDPTTLLWEGTSGWDYNFPYTFLNPYESNADITLESEFYAADPAPRLNAGSVTTRFQFDAADADDALTISSYIGRRLDWRTYARMTWNGAGWWLGCGIEETFAQTESQEVGSVEVLAALTADTDYWLTVTRDGATVAAALYDEDPALNAAAVPVAEVPATVIPKADLWSLTADLMPGFGWSVQDALARATLVRIYGMSVDAQGGGLPFDLPDAARVMVMDSGSKYDPTPVLNFIGFGIQDNRPMEPGLTISLPGVLPSLIRDQFSWAGALTPYLTQNVAIDDNSIQANLAGDDGRVVMASTKFDIETSAMFVGVAADDQFGVILHALDIDSYVLVRVNNDTTTPVLEIVEVNNNAETLIRSKAITQIINGAAGPTPWTVVDPVWVVGRLDEQGYITAAVYDATPEHSIGGPLYTLGARLLSPMADRIFAAGGGYGATLVPAAGGGNTLRMTDLIAKGTE